MTILAAMLGYAGTVTAFDIQSANPDVSMRFDNSLRYNTAWRVVARSPGLANNPANDEAEYLRNKGEVITNRLDLFSEFDFEYQKRMGFRVSSALWYDAAYGEHGKSNPLLADSPNYPGNRFSNYVKRYYTGPSGEFLDSFVWSNLRLGDTELALKLGRHAVIWGEATFPVASANSVAVDMAPADGQKQAASPGATAKETTLPVNQLTATWQFSPRLSLSAQYTLEWRPSRLPESGTYLGVSDAILFGPPLINGGGPLVPRASRIGGNKGDVGLALKWRSDWLNDGDLGFYFRKYDAKTPTWAANTLLAPGPQALAVYAKDISLWGISYGSTLWGNAIGAEISYRHNTPLNMNPAAITNAALGFEGPRGDTWHTLVNSTSLINKRTYFDSATLSFELSYQVLDRLTRNPQFYKSTGTTPAACTADELVKGCSTKSAWHFAALFSPVWAQVLPSADLTVPIVFQTGLKGNAPTTGINQGASVFNITFQLDYAVVHRFSLAYTNFWGKREYLGSASPAGAFQAANGTPATYDDRDNIAFTYSYTF